MSPKLSIVVLAWNQCDVTLACLDSLSVLNYPANRPEIILVDNGSTDDTTRAVQASCPSVSVLTNKENLGYAGGNNVGLRHALVQDADYVCILNNDVRVSPDFLAPLLAACQSRPDVGIATPLVAEAVDSQKIWALGSAVNWKTAEVTRLHAGEPVSVWQFGAPLEVDVASGTAMLVSRQVLEQVGLLDEAFYLYYEETDWCLRARRAGYRILAVPSSVVWHKVSATLGQTSPVIDYYMVRNHLLFIARHAPAADRLRLLGQTVLCDVLTIAAFTVKPHRGRRLPHRNARVLALRDAFLGRWGRMGADVTAICYPNSR